MEPLYLVDTRPCPRDYRMPCTLLTQALVVSMVLQYKIRDQENPDTLNLTLQVKDSLCPVGAANYTTTDTLSALNWLNCSSNSFS